MDIDMTTNAKIMHNIIYDNFGRWAKTSFCSTTKNHFKEWIMNQKRPNHFPRPFIFLKITTIYFFSHVYQLHALLIYGSKFILELYFLEIVKNVYP